MSITSIGSSFSTVTLVQAPSPIAPVERVVEVAAESATADQDQRSGTGGGNSSPSASAVPRDTASLAPMLVTQEAAGARPTTSAHDGAQAYAVA